MAGWRQGITCTDGGEREARSGLILTSAAMATDCRLGDKAPAVEGASFDP